MSMQVVSESKEVTLPSGVKYKDLKIGGGSNTQKGYLMVVDYKSVFQSCRCIFVQSIS